MATRKPTPRRDAGDIDVDDELQQLLKEQEAFMRQSQRPAAKITRVGPPQVTPVVEKNVAEAKEEEQEDEMEQGVQVVGHVQERDVIQLTETNRILQPRKTAGGFPAMSRRGVSLFGRRNRQQPAPTSETGKLSGNGKIVERAPVVASALGAKSKETTELQSKPKRSDVVSDKEWDEIDQTNTAALRNMSTADIREAQQELLQMLDPELIAKLKNRSKVTQPTKTQPIKPEATKPTMDEVKTGSNPVTPVVSKRMDVVNATKALVAAGIDLSKIETEEELFAQAQRLPAEERAKHEWMQPIDAPDDSPKPKSASKKRHPVRQSQSKKPASPASTERFDFSGDLVVSSASVPVHTGLYHHGDDPEAAGYTMDELLHLARSTVASQRAMALVTVSKILRKRQSVAEKLPRVLPKELLVALRMTLDDQNYTALSAAIAALHAFLVPLESKEYEFESTRGTVVATPTIHLHVDEGTTKDELLHEVVYIDTAESPEDGGAIGDQELSSLDPVQGLLKMDIVSRLSYILTTIQLPDADAMDKLLEILIRIASHSPRAAQAVAADAKLMKALQAKYLENELVLTLQTEAGEEFSRAVSLTHKTLVLVRVLCQGHRSVATLLIERGVIQSTKGFLALRGDQVAVENPLEYVQLESLRIWRVLLGYGVDFHCFSYLYPLLCGFDGVNLVQDKAEGSAGVKKWSDRNLAAVLAALEAFARLDSIHEAQHYFNQFGFFITLAKDELFRRLPSLATDGHVDAVVSACLRFLSVCCPLVAKFHLNRLTFHALLKQLQTQLATSTWRRQLTASPQGREFLVVMMAFAGQVLQNDLLSDDEDDDEIRAQLLQQLKPVVLNAIAASQPTRDSPLQTCELLLLTTDLFVRVDHHDDEFIRFIYATALQTVQDLKPGHQFWLHSLFAGVLFHPIVLQKTGFFPDFNDATTMSRILIPIYQALVNSTKEQEEHSRLLFASRANAKQKQTCHLVEPQDEQVYIGSNLPLPFFWMFCPFSRLEYTPPQGNAAEEQQRLKHAATTLGPSHAQADEMKVIVSAACRYLDQLETIVGGAVRSSSASASQSALGDEDKLFHLMHVFFAGADVLFDEYVDLALAKLLQKYATSVVANANPTALYDAMLRNLRQFESIEAGEVREPAKSEDGAPKTSFTSETETVMTFVEKLVNEFTSSSFGNMHFARLVTLFLLHDFPLEIRKWVWKELADSHLLHRLEPFQGSDARLNTGRRATRSAKKSDETLIRAMAHAVANHKQGVVSHERGPFAYWIAVHHIVAYTFGDDDTSTSELSFSRQKLLQSLTQNASPVVWRHLLSYDASSFAPTPDAPVKQQRVDRVLQRGGLSEAQATVVKDIVATW